MKRVIFSLCQLLLLLLAMGGCSGKGGAEGAGPGSGPGPGGTGPGVDGGTGVGTDGGIDGGTGGGTDGGVGSPDGGTGPTRYAVVFHSFRSTSGGDAATPNPAGNIWRVNSDGTELAPITLATALLAHSYNPQWSPDGTKVAFYSSRDLNGVDAPHPNFNIWQVRSDGTHLSPITTNMAVAHDYNPQWSPDGSKIVFHSTRRPAANLTGSVINIWRVNADGSQLTALTRASTHMTDSENPHWSPDGSQIVFQSRRHLDLSDAPHDNLTFNIWRVNGDGLQLTPITTATVEGTDSSKPHWSPDGAWIVFQSRRHLDGSDAAHPKRTLNIWKMKADGSGLTALTKDNAVGVDNDSPQWSPDGTRIVFQSKRKLDGSEGVSSATNIWRVNADGTGLIPLTTTLAAEAHSIAPQWSPDGTRVFFQSRRKVDGSDDFGPAYNIWSVNADGTGLTALTKTVVVGADSSNPQLKR